MEGFGGRQGDEGVVALDHQCVPNYLPVTGLPCSLGNCLAALAFQKMECLAEGNALDDRGGWPGCGTPKQWPE